MIHKTPQPHANRPPTRTCASPQASRTESAPYNLFKDAVEFARSVDGKLLLGPNNSSITGGGVGYRLECTSGTYFLKLQNPEKKAAILRESAAATWAREHRFGPAVLPSPPHLGHAIATRWLDAPNLT